MSGAFKPKTGAASGATSTSQIFPNEWPSYSSTGNDQGYAQGWVSPDPTLRENAWQIPPSVAGQVFNEQTGISNQVPTSASDRVMISQAVQMIDLYGKLSELASGKKVTFSTAEIDAASQLKGDVARAVQMSGSKNGKNAAGAAITEIATRLKNTVDIGPEDLSNFQKSKVGPKLSNLLQNSGYAVTKNMTLTQMLNETSGPKATTPLGTMSQGMTVGQYVQGLGNLTKDQMSQLQSSLFSAGLYDPSYYDGSKVYATGVLDVGTISAMRNAMKTALQSGTTVENVIGGNLPVPTTASQQPQTPSPLPGTTNASDVPQTSSAQLQEPLIKAFEATLGRAPTQQELQTFTENYNQSQEAASKYAVSHGLTPQTNMDLQTGVPFISTTPTASASAASDAMNANPVEYQAHGISDAFGMLMNLVDRQGTSALNTPGRSPNMTS